MGDGNGLLNPQLGGKAASGVIGAALGMLITYTTAVSGQNEQLAILSEKVASLEKQITSSMGDRYRGADATRDFNLVNHQLDLHQKRLDSMETRVDNHIQDYKRHSDGKMD